jgi:hypothetical protein
MNEFERQEGVDKREYFAGLAMQGMLANLNGALLSGGTKTLHPNHIAEMSVIHANALLAELKKTEKQKGAFIKCDDGALTPLMEGEYVLLGGEIICII